VHEQRFHHGEADRQTRIERCERVLEDELDIAPQCLQRMAFELADVASVEFDGTALAFDEP